MQVPLAESGSQFREEFPKTVRSTGDIDAKSGRLWKNSASIESRPSADPINEDVQFFREEMIIDDDPTRDRPTLKK
jgi:hypothetical protein